MSLCNSITLIKSTPNGDLLDVLIDNDKHAYWFYKYADALQYIGQEVIVSYRKDIFEGEMHDFINTFTIPTKVAVLDREDNPKLFCDIEDNASNISFNGIADGEHVPGCIFYCINQQYKSSPKADWLEITVRDKLMHIATLRIFSTENRDVDFTGYYAMAELYRNSYGLSSEFISRLDNNGVAANPEIALAEKYIINYCAKDEVLNNYVQKTDLIRHIKEHMDFEPGYSLVRMAMELDMCSAMNNITKDIDLTTLGRVIVLSYGHLTKNNKYLSDSFLNTATALNFPFEDKKTILECLDEALEVRPPEAQVYMNIKNTVNTLLNIRKGVTLLDGTQPR